MYTVYMYTHDIFYFAQFHCRKSGCLWDLQNSHLSADVSRSHPQKILSRATSVATASWSMSADAAMAFLARLDSEIPQQWF